MLQGRKRHGERLRLLQWLCVLLPLLCLALPVGAASPPAAAPAAEQPAKIHELLDLLGDPRVQEWIKAQQAARAAAPAPTAETKAEDQLASRLTAIRTHLQALVV